MLVTPDIGEGDRGVGPSLPSLFLSCLYLSRFQGTFLFISVREALFTIIEAIKNEGNS